MRLCSPMEDLPQRLVGRRGVAELVRLHRVSTFTACIAERHAQAQCTFHTLSTIREAHSHTDPNRHEPHGTSTVTYRRPERHRLHQHGGAPTHTHHMCRHNRKSNARRQQKHDRQATATTTTERHSTKTKHDHEETSARQAAKATRATTTTTMTITTTTTMTTMEEEKKTTRQRRRRRFGEERDSRWQRCEAPARAQDTPQTRYPWAEVLGRLLPKEGKPKMSRLMCLITILQVLCKLYSKARTASLRTLRLGSTAGAMS